MKKLFAVLLACALLLCTACASSGESAGKNLDLNESGFLPLPLKGVAWEATLEELQEKYPNSTVSTVGEDPLSTTILMVEGGDFGQVLSTDVAAVDFMFKPVLPYHGAENKLVLYRVGVKLAGGNYDSLAAQLDETMGEGMKGNDLNAKQVRIWMAEKGLWELEATAAALAVALDPSPVDSARPTLFGTAATAADDAAKWEGIDLSDAAACEELKKLLTKGDSCRRISLFDREDGVYIYYNADGMTCAPLALELLADSK